MVRSPIARSSVSLRRLPRGRFADLLGTISGLGVLAFARRYHRLAPLRSPRAGTCSRGPGALLPRRPRRLFAVESTRPPRFLDDPCLQAPLSDPGGPPAPGLLGAGDTAFRVVDGVGSAHTALSRLNHAAYRLPVYASQAESIPHNATLGTGWWPTFAGSGLAPAGSQREFPSWLSVNMTSPLTRLCLAQQRVAHPPLPMKPLQGWPWLPGRARRVTPVGECWGSVSFHL